MPPRTAQQEMAGTGNSTPIPAPVGGMNTRDGLMMLKPEEARLLQNWLPDLGGCVVRPGYEVSCVVGGGSTADTTFITADITTVRASTAFKSITVSGTIPIIATLRSATQPKFLASCAGGLFDITGSVASRRVSAGTYHSDLWVTECFNGYMFGVNGTDTPWRYNGTTVGATGFSGSGLTLSNLQTVTMVKGRLWFTEVDSADVWYGPSAGVTGALTKFQLSQIVQGGKCVGIGSWSYEGGGGPLDQTVFIMDTGEVLIYSGDPATTFAKVGTFHSPAPVGLNSWVKIGGELIIITANGPIPISFIYRGIAFDLTQLQVWGKVSPSWQKDYQIAKSYNGFFGYYCGGILYFNMPISASSSKQYVLNTRIPAWTIYTNLPVASMADDSGVLYFGGGDGPYIYRHASKSDNGNQIIALARQAFSYPMGKNLSVMWTLFRPNIETTSTASGQFQVDVDYGTDEITSSVVELSAIATGASWGDPWGSAWSGAPIVQKQFLGVSGYGCAVAPVAQVYSSSGDVTWYSSDVVGVRGGIL